MQPHPAARAFPAPAKLNLDLRIIGRRADGYHLLESIFCLIDLCDTVWLLPREDGQIILHNPAGGIPPEQDLSHRAATTAELSRQLLGYDLPVAYIDRWANGLRVPGEPYSVLPDGRLQQMGWKIQRNLGEDGQVRMLLLERTGLSLRLVFDRFGQPEQHPGSCADHAGQAV